MSQNQKAVSQMLKRVTKDLDERARRAESGFKAEKKKRRAKKPREGVRQSYLLGDISKLRV